MLPLHLYIHLHNFSSQPAQTTARVSRHSAHWLATKCIQTHTDACERIVYIYYARVCACICILSSVAASRWISLKLKGLNAEVWSWLAGWLVGALAGYAVHWHLCASPSSVGPSSVGPSSVWCPSTKQHDALSLSLTTAINAARVRTSPRSVYASVCVFALQVHLQM